MRKVAWYAALTLVVIVGGTLVGRPQPTEAKAQRALASVRFIKRGLTVAAPHKPGKRGKLKQKLFQAYRLQTRAGQKASIAFADRSVLHMNQRTDLTLRSSSVTYLTSGEADVIDAPGVHHTVQTATATVAAIGTQYVVQVLGSKGNVQVMVTVVDGAVQVKTNKGAQTVVPGQQVTVAPDGTISAPKSIPIQTAVGWTQEIPQPSFVSEVKVGTVRLFKGSDAPATNSGNCAAVGEQATTSFVSTDVVIEVKAVFSKWKGTHTFSRQFVDPSGRVVDAVDYRISNVGSGYQRCMWVVNGGWSGLSVSGTWTVRLLVDAVVVKTVTYSMTKTSDSVITPIGSIAVLREPAAPPTNIGTCNDPNEVQSTTISPNDYAVVVDFGFSVWQGTHTILATWTAPDGSAFFKDPHTYTDQGYGGWCEWLYVKGTSATTKPGTWKVEITADGKTVFSASFTLSSSAFGETGRVPRGSATGGRGTARVLSRYEMTSHSASGSAAGDG